MASSAAASFALTASLAPAFVFSYVVVVDACSLGHVLECLLDVLIREGAVA